ncbi:phosphoribosylanthranilate isomerase [Mucilaginibacter roseus]|uniref:N-(5'-phosphoribosyl)anthranilate isomerase n=1 Tax=Mucilaginibacter roseus TaxID=1528868 RepID=A0ABS8U7G6_9SPHI|nr:phosphoribosylanthranilate isomerase [Mucilaginibacter roseus]MCD8742080.1 phosphoribosylanthranilate isomerase [Mucilaginibacter roseus]
MKIKVCGLKEPDNISEVVALQPDYVGFICYNKSPRYIDVLVAGALEQLPKNITKTGVFVNESAEQINALIEKYNFKAIQLHGSETPEFCALFKGRIQVIKAFGVDADFDFDTLKPYENVVDIFLFDTKTAAHGGSGKTFDWQVLTNYTLNVPFFLSGGIGLGNLEEVKTVKHPQLAGLDLNSRFELSPGNKDINKLKQAFEIIKQL